MSGRIAIVGIGTTEFARSILAKSASQLRLEAAKAALDDAGLSVRDVDGLILNENRDQPRYHMEFGEMLGIYEKTLCISSSMGGASAGYSIEIGRWALQSGRCRYVLCVAGNRESVAGIGKRGSGMTDEMAHLSMHYPNFEHPYGPLLPSYYAVIAQRHMYEYGTTAEQLASVPVAIRHNAGLNPDAIYRKPITVEDVLASKPISTPLNLLHCCMVSDGAIAFVLTTEERARDLRQKPVYVLGHGGGQAGYFTAFLAAGGTEQGYSLTRTVARRAATDAFAEAGLAPAEMDLTTLCDNFAITPMVLLEDYGFCKKGEAGAFVGDGSRIKVGGELPVNPHGGLLSCNHAATNYQNYTEMTLQLRQAAGARQVEGAKLGLAGSCAGIISTHYATVLAAD